MSAIDSLLIRLFVGGFYRQYSGVFLLLGLLFVGMCPPGQHWEVWVGLALATVSQSWLLAITVILFSLYLLLIVLFVWTKFKQEPYHFLRYSLEALPRSAIGYRWLLIGCTNGLPLLFFGATAATAGFLTGKHLLPGLLLLYIIVAFAACFGVIRRLTEPLTWTNRTILPLDFGTRWGSNYVLLGLRQVLSAQRVPYLLAKLLSYLFVSCLFFIYADVRDHTGVAMLVLTATVMGHSTVISGQFIFERETLSLFRNLPHRKMVRFGQISPWPSAVRGAS